MTFAPFVTTTPPDPVAAYPNMHRAGCSRTEINHFTGAFANNVGRRTGNQGYYTQSGYKGKQILFHVVFFQVNS
jgi:hypothetical protein